MKQVIRVLSVFSLALAFTGFVKSMHPDSVNYALAYCIKDQTIVLLQRSHTGFHDGDYGLPGGKIEPGESAQQAVIRELKEELGITVTPEHAQLTHVMSFNGITQGDHIALIFTIDAWQGEMRNNEPEKHSHFAWFLPTDLPQNILFRHKDMIDAIVQERFYSQQGY